VWEDSINYVAKKFNATWEEVVQWNIVWFMYKSEWLQKELAKEVADAHANKRRGR
jgi:hypothetical protein